VTQSYVRQYEYRITGLVADGRECGVVGPDSRRHLIPSWEGILFIMIAGKQE